MLVYGLCLIIGGTFVLISALGGLDGVDFAPDFDTDFEVDTGAGGDFDDIDVGTHGRPGASTRRLRWLPITSLRFWTFALCFFGLTGLLVSFAVPDMAGWLVALIAVVMGLLCGTAAVVVLRSINDTGANSLTRPEELTGQIGTVEIPFDANSRGKVRLSIRGSTVAFFAFTQEDRTFRQGESVLVVGLEHNKLWVASTDALPSQNFDGGK
jgi:membrane protein implicated in regulation of membrane protease activity